ncbi:hypothetical protein [Desulfosoma caldarium]|uniref:Uncharacterized protein n=1 Tax=Desulfosoma caldarium TaxID=610254 RepID=A0A3N1VFC0_9BACT|nr:hypothetical protein [Desulfosoma caldarium]ROR01585.1 hypothetical protein EDC27_0764 [Desulfosoma caldarium]
MAELIDLMERKKMSTLICARPMEFRWGEWASGPAWLCARSEAVKYESRRLESRRVPGHAHLQWLPNHVKLDGGTHDTVQALFRYRNDEKAMRRVYRLAGLMECVTRGVCPVLRSDLLRRIYQDIMEERNALQVVWRGSVDRFLLPLYLHHGLVERLLTLLKPMENLQELFSLVERETTLQFDVLSSHYVIYVPLGFARLNV